MLTLEAEIGPVKYIAALAVDWGITDQVETSKAVRWVILLLIVVFDPLAVLLLIAANQSLMRRFPPEAPKPQEIVDLEKPDEEGIDLKWNAMMDKTDAVAKMELATEQLQEWKDKLEAFNNKVPKPEDRPVEIIQEDDGVIPHIDLVGQKKTEDKEIVADNSYSYLDEVAYEILEPKVDKEKQIEEFKKREAEELEALEEISRKAREEETTVTVEEALKMSEAESVETPIQEERIKPDFTEVIEPESKGKHPKKNTVASLGQRIVESKTGKVVKPPKPTLSNWQRAELLDNFHKEHGNFEDVKEYVQNEEQNDNTLWQQVNKSKKKLNSQEEYHRRVEQRIEDLMLKVDNGELSLEDLTPEDRQVIIDINNQNKV